MKNKMKSSWLQWDRLRWALLGIGVAGLLLRAAIPTQAMRVESLLQQHDFDLVGPERHAFAKYLVELAEQNHFDPMMVMAVIKVESEFRVSAKSERGAMRLLQLKPVAAKEVADQLNFEIKSKHELLDPFKNLNIGVQYLVYLRDLFGMNWERMLVAYNIGPTAVKNMRHLPQGYFRKVMRAYQELQEI